MTLAAHHEPLWSARIARYRRSLDLVGALPAVWRAERRGAREQKLLPRREIDTRPGPDPYKDGPDSRPIGYPRTDIRMPYLAVTPQNGAPPSSTEPCSRRSGCGHTALPHPEEIHPPQFQITP